MDAQCTRLRHFAFFWIPPLMLIVLGFVLFSSSGRDDSYITYWPARSLALQGEILNYNGARIEQSSSLFEVILLALVHLITRIDIDLIGPVLSIFAGAASVVVAERLARKIDSKCAFAASLLVATAVYFVYWSFGGLDVTLTSLAILLLILGYGGYLTSEKPASAGQVVLLVSATFMFLLVRPEMPVVLFCVLLAMLIITRVKRLDQVPVDIRKLGVLALVGGLLTAALVGFRLAYFGSAVPQAVLAKVDGSLAQSTKHGALLSPQSILGNNIDVDWFHSPPIPKIPVVLANLAVVVAIVIGIGLCGWSLLRAKAVNVYALLAMWFIGAYVGFIVFAGGDWMEGGRFIAHILPVCMIFAALALTSAIRTGWGRRSALVGLVVCQLGLLCILRGMYPRACQFGVRLTATEILGATTRPPTSTGLSVPIGSICETFRLLVC